MSAESTAPSNSDAAHAIESLTALPMLTRSPACRLLATVLHTITQHPSDLKFRRLARSKISAKLGAGSPAGLALLHSLGFAPSIVQGESDFMVWSAEPTAADIERLKPVVQKLEAMAGTNGAAGDGASAASSSSAAAPSNSATVPPDCVPLPHHPIFAARWSAILPVIAEALDCCAATTRLHRSAAAAATSSGWNAARAAAVMRRLAYSQADIDLRCLGLVHFVESYVEELEQREEILLHSIPFMLRLIQRLPEIFDPARPENRNLTRMPPACIPILHANVEGAVVLTKMQLAALLACGFFGLHAEATPRGSAAAAGAPSSAAAATAGYGFGSSARKFKTANFDGLWCNVGKIVSKAQASSPARKIGTNSEREVEKLKCLCEYVRRTRLRVESTEDEAHPMHATNARIMRGVVSFHRRVLQERSKEIAARMLGTAPEPSNAAAAGAASIPGADSVILPTELRSSGTIEDDGEGTLQIDFANRFLGGGVLTRGCVQEEIRMTICPESLVGILFVECMDDHEAVTIIGAERFANYSGYGDTFQYAGPHFDPTPVDPLANRLCTVLVAIDATSYRERSTQYHAKAVLREIIKAYAGFSVTVDNAGVEQQTEGMQLTTYVLPTEAATSGNAVAVSSAAAAAAAAASSSSSAAASSCSAASPAASSAALSFRAISTGNWGCGAFNGDIVLKFMIQCVASTLAARRLRYFTFSDPKCAALEGIVALFEERAATIRQVYSVCRRYNPRDMAGRTETQYVTALLESASADDAAADVDDLAAAMDRVHVSSAGSRGGGRGGRGGRGRGAGH